MTTPLRGSLLFDDPGELIAAVPGLLRFTPTDSVVLVTYTGPRAFNLEAVLRMDLPEPEHVTEAVAQLRMVAINHNATVVELLLIGGIDTDDPPDPPELPCRELVEELDDMFDRAGIVLSHAVWAPRVERGLTWWCYQDPECSGQIRDPVGSPVMAAMTVAGIVPFASRADLAAQLAPDPADALTRRAELLNTLPPVDPERAFPYIRDTLDATATATASAEGPFIDLDDDTIVRVAQGLSHSDVRDACLSFALTVRAGPAERLWTALTRASPAPVAAEPATLLAVCAYLRGEGALAGVAIEAALTANPDHSFAHTIRRIMDCGLPPHKFRAMLTDSFIAAFSNR